MANPDWHGWSICDVLGPRSMHIGLLPSRLLPALYIIGKDDQITVLARFLSDADAECAMDLIDQLARVGKYAKEGADVE